MNRRDGWTVYFDSETMQEIEQKAQERTHGGRLSMKTLKLRHNNDYVGVLGEYAYAFVYDIPFEQVQGYIAGGDGGVDFYLPDGRSVDVKNSLGRNLRLCNYTQRDIKSDLIVGATSTDVDNATLCAWMTRSYWSENNEVHPYTGSGWATWLNQMEQMETFPMPMVIAVFGRQWWLRPGTRRL